MLKKWKTALPVLLAALLLAGCGGNPGNSSASSETPSSGVSSSATAVEGEEENFFVDAVTLEEVELEDEMIALTGAPALSKNLVPQASGTKVEKSSKATIDYSNTKDGYVMVRYTAQTTKKLKVQVIGPHAPKPYIYNIAAGEWVTFPLSDGNGNYTIKVMENTKDNLYAAVATAKITVQLTDEFAPFLRPNQYVDYEEATNTIAQAQKLIGKETDTMKKVQKVYEYVVKNFSYDYDLASNVSSGKITSYLPDLDSALKKKKGICFDYAALMTGMLRSQGVPCKLVVGYAGESYHAWINVWSEESGWMDAAIYFDGHSWQRMDPTFASTGKSSEKIMKFIGDGENYNPMYFY
ncbi:transglutaminase-like domain-containing protein [Oscillospiraceae bacterium 42-9]